MLTVLSAVPADKSYASASTITPIRFLKSASVYEMAPLSFASANDIASAIINGLLSSIKAAAVELSPPF